MEWISNSEEGLSELATSVLEHAAGAKKMAFYGEIGAGKTSLIKALCGQLGVEDAVTSPTFSLVNEYLIAASGCLVRHIDLYRLRNFQEALEIGIEDFLDDEHYCFIEWPGLIEAYLAPETIKINIEIINKNSRKILFL